MRIIDVNKRKYNISCDNCGKIEIRDYYDEEDIMNLQHELEKQGWQRVHYHSDSLDKMVIKDFCCDRCEQQFIKRNNSQREGEIWLYNTLNSKNNVHKKY